jgi:hypothetical protein
MDENPYKSPQTECAAKSWIEAAPPLDTGFWLVLLISPLLVFGGLAIGQWLFP